MELVSTKIRPLGISGLIKHKIWVLNKTSRSISYICILVVLLFGCKKSMPRNGLFNSKEYFLEIRKDSSFLFEKKGAHFYAHNKGVWSRNLNSKNRIYLNTDHNQTNLNFEINLSGLDSLEKPKIKTLVETVDNNKSLKNFSFWVFSNKEAISHGNCDKIPEFLNQEVKTIQYYFNYVSDSTTTTGGGKLSEVIQIRPNMNIEIRFLLDTQNFDKIPFNATKMKFKKNKVFLFDFDQNRKITLKEFKGDTQHFFKRY